MREFFDVTSAFPAALFGFALLVVIGYWVLVLLGGFGVDIPHGGEDVDAGVPVTVSISLFIVIAWFVSLTGTAMSDDFVLRLATLPVALLAGWAGTRVLLLPLRRLVTREPASSRDDFVGLMCVIRTGRVSADFGQAEVTAADGSSALVQVRIAGPADEGLGRGSSALIFDYDAEGEFFRVTPFQIP